MRLGERARPRAGEEHLPGPVAFERTIGERDLDGLEQLKHLFGLLGEVPLVVAPENLFGDGSITTAFTVVEPTSIPITSFSGVLFRVIARFPSSRARSLRYRCGETDRADSSPLN